jgi:hypothetical protein
LLTRRDRDDPIVRIANFERPQQSDPHREDGTGRLGAPVSAE